MAVLPACPSGAVATDATATNDATGDTTADPTAEPTDGVASTGLVDAAGGDHHLAADSPAHASGAPLSDLHGDIDGFCYGDPPNRGAFAWP